MSQRREIRRLESLAEIAASDWDQLSRDHYPFTRHAFLHGLQQGGCLEPFGWHPHYFVAYEGDQLIAALATYIKTNSYGELVFDHSWAQAYQQVNLEYYPKLVTAIPYTPATGARFLTLPDLSDSDTLLQHMLATVRTFCEMHQLSSWHILFTDAGCADHLDKSGFVQRHDCQYHWHNRDYADFDAFLAQLNSRKRKNLRKERGSIGEQQLKVEEYRGDQLSMEQVTTLHRLYASIFERKYGTATLSEDFFQYICGHMGEQVLVYFASDESGIIAASLLFRSDTHLYGRVWGDFREYRNLHFELCYYRGIDYCIRHGLKVFDPGAQGEHKIARGFLPTKTYSSHWLRNSHFQELIERYLKQEREYLQQQCEQLMQASPYRNESTDLA